MNASTRRRMAELGVLVAAEGLAASLREYQDAELVEREAELRRRAAEKFGLDLSTLPLRPTGMSHSMSGEELGVVALTLATEPEAV